jgi:hypothetical protein
VFYRLPQVNQVLSLDLRIVQGMFEIVYNNKLSVFQSYQIPIGYIAMPVTAPSGVIKVVDNRINGLSYTCKDHITLVTLIAGARLIRSYPTVIPSIEEFEEDVLNVMHACSVFMEQVTAQEKFNKLLI